jgi:hypothetical protein
MRDISAAVPFFAHFLRDEPAHWRQLYAHSTAGERRIGLRQMHTITPAKVLRHHIYGS